MHRFGLALAWIVLATSACAPKWKASLLVDSRQVAKALGDPVAMGPAEAFDPSRVPNFDPPKKVRPCCAFGQDLKAKLGEVPVPIYELKNIISAEEVGPHGYDKGDLTREHNGLVYTCRGGFVDIAHVRDHADKTLYVAMQIVRALPGGVTIDMPEEGTARRITVKPLPKGLLDRHGRWAVAVALASWVGYRLATWHEVVTWYGWESTLGFSERLSAFSPEDNYSNILGVNIAAGIILNREMRSRDEYDEAMQAWIREALRRLAAVPKEQGRQAMKAVDGLWWDSSKRVPDYKLVTRRALDIDSPVAPWIVADSVPAEKADPEIKQMCAGKPPPLPLEIADKIGDVKIEDLVTIEFKFASWVPSHFPLPAQTGKSVTQADFPTIIEDIRRQGKEDLGPDFDRPKAAPSQ